VNSEEVIEINWVIFAKGILDWGANFYKNTWNSYYKRGKSFSYLKMKRICGRKREVFEVEDVFEVFRR
jgi:hypothetical protein